MRPVSEWLTALRTSFWFLPILMATGGAVLARAALAIEIVVPLWRDVGGQEESGLLLSTLAGSLMTVTGVVFSLTVVTLHLASNQYGPRLLRSFMRDRGTQLVLGTFVATFSFCIVSLVGRPPPNSLAVALALALTAASVVVLIYFIHHLATSIQAESIVGAVADQLEHEIERTYPHRIGQANAARLPAGRPIVVPSATDGYVVSIDHDALGRAAGEAKTALQAVVRQGQYIVRGDPLMLAWSDHVPEAAVNAFGIESRRTETDDVEFSIQQISQVAARALSAGINDPYTAVTCIHRLTSAYCRLGSLDDGPHVEQKAGATVVVPRVTFNELLRAGLGAIRQHADSAQVQGHLLDALGRIAVSVQDPSRHRALRAELEAVMEVAEKANHPRIEREQLQERFQQAMSQLEATTAPVDLQRR